MAPPFKKLSRLQFAQAVAAHTWSPAKTEIHVHHTWRPNHAQYNGVHSINGMYKYHTETKHWSDIAQHVSVAPDGAIWTGRPWNKSPASAKGFNGRHVFMFETIGDFDTGKDRLIGEQLESVLFIVATLQIYFGLPLWASIRFHNQMSSKTCPGSSIDRSQFIAQVKKKRQELEAEEVAIFSAPKIDMQGALESALAAVEGPAGQTEDLLPDDGELSHSPQLEAFMAAYHANPFIPVSELAPEVLDVSGGVPAQTEAVTIVNSLAAAPQAAPAEDPDDVLFAELGRRARMIEAHPGRAAELSMSIEATPEGFFDSFAELGRRIFARVEREFHKLLCGSASDDISDRAKLRDAFGLGADAVTGVVVAVLMSTFGLAPAIAAIIAALLIRRVLKPTYEESCKFWGERLD